MLQELQGVPNQINEFSAVIIKDKIAKRIPPGVKKLWAGFNLMSKGIPRRFILSNAFDKFPSPQKYSINWKERRCDDRLQRHVTILKDSNMSIILQHPFPAVQEMLDSSSMSRLCRLWHDSLVNLAEKKPHIKLESWMHLQPPQAKWCHQVTHSQRNPNLLQMRFPKIFDAAIIQFDDEFAAMKTPCPNRKGVPRWCLSFS